MALFKKAVVILLRSMWQFLNSTRMFGERSKKDRSDVLFGVRSHHSLSDFLPSTFLLPSRSDVWIGKMFRIKCALFTTPFATSTFLLPACSQQFPAVSPLFTESRDAPALADKVTVVFARHSAPSHSHAHAHTAPLYRKARFFHAPTSCGDLNVWVPTSCFYIYFHSHGSRNSPDNT